VVVIVIVVLLLLYRSVITRLVIPVVFYDITNAQCVYWSDTTIFIGRI